MYGGKADSLLKLKENCFNVPDYFIIDINDYKQFLEENNLINNIEKLIKENKRDTIISSIKNAEIGETLEIKIKKQFDKLNSKRISVRSSALNEDGKSKAFAGQYDSFLNVNEQDLLEKIKLC